MIENSSDLEYILTLDANESPHSKASLAKAFVESKHSVVEYATFFYWLASELDKGEVEFKDLIFCELHLDRAKARLLSVWLLRLLD